MIIGDGIMLGAVGDTASIFVTGLNDTDTVTASKNGKTIIGKWTQIHNPASVVPDGYTQLEYIESAGTQYIDTGISVPHESLKVVVQFSTSNTTQDAPISGYAYSTWGWSTNMLYVSNNQKFGVNGVVGPTVVAGTVYEVEYSNTYFKINGATTSAVFTGYVDGYNNTVFYGNGKRGQYKLYFYKLNNGSLLVRDYVPAKRNSDGSVGLYDLVSNTFFGNSGTGTFVAGPEIPQTIDGFLIDKIKDYGTWTVTATNGTNTQTLDVFVDAANTFFVNIKYIYRYDDMVLWLDGTDFLDHSKNGLTMNRGAYPLLDTAELDKPETNCYLFNNNSASTAFYTLSNPVVNMDGFSFSWWMKVSSKPSYSCCWYMSKDASVSGSYAIGCNTTIGTTGKYGVCARTPSGATADVTSTYVTPTNTSLHCVQTYDGATMKLYVNGQLVWSASNSLGFSSVSVGRINIGHNMWNTSVERFMGYMTDIRLYNAVLTSDEILEMFETGTEIHS